MSVRFHIGFNSKHRQAAGAMEAVSLKGDNGSAVILIHGLTGTPHELSFLARYLNGKGYSVICPVLANHGEALEVLKNTSWQECYESVRASLEQIPESSGAIFVSGLSMGALLALLLAKDFPQRIKGVSCLSPTLFYDGWNTPWTKSLLPLVRATGLENFLYFKEEPPYGIKNERIRSLVHKYYSAASFSDLDNIGRFGYPYFPVRLLNEIRSLAKHVIGELPRISTPVQLIQAKDDDMTSVRNSQLIYDKISSGVKEMLLLFDSYHVITADQERDKVAEAMERFFARINSEGLAACAK